MAVHSTLKLPKSDFYFSSLAAANFIVNFSYENLVLDQDNYSYLISLSILITCLLDNISIIYIYILKLKN